MKRRPQGVALIVALLAVALATLLIAGLLDRGELEQARTRNLLRGEQAQAYVEGLEAFAARVLLRAADESPGVDAADSLWALPLPPQTVPGGTLAAEMRDRNGCFNVNNVAPGVADRSAWIDMLRRLLAHLQLDPALADAITGWTDANASDAGDGWYLSQPVPYRRALRGFVDVSELRLVSGVDSRVYATLLPHVCALPSGTRVNINTAGVVVLMSLSDRMTRALAERTWQGGRARWLQVNDFIDSLRTAGIADAQRLSSLVATGSDWFEVRSAVVLDDITFRYTSLVQRQSVTGVRVVARQRGSAGTVAASRLPATR